MNTGKIHILTGDGKGKTSAAVGQAIRMAGAGGKVLFCQFLKSGNSCEINILNEISNITIHPITRVFGFIFQMSESEKLEASVYYTSFLTSIIDTCNSTHYDMLILDEILSAIDTGMVPESKVINFLNNKPSHLEIIMTGRNTTKKLTALADYISDIKCIKHPYNSGLEARKGIEY